MKQYLLSIYQPDGPAPEPAVMDAIMADVTELDQDLRAAGAWVFCGGCSRPAPQPWCGAGATCW